LFVVGLDAVISIANGVIPAQAIGLHLILLRPTPIIQINLNDNLLGKPKIASISNRQP